MMKALCLFTVFVSTLGLENIPQPFKVDFVPAVGDNVELKGQIGNNSKVIITIHQCEQDYIKAIIRVPYNAITYSMVRANVDHRYPHYSYSFANKNNIAVKITFLENYIVLHVGKDYIGAVNYIEGEKYETYKYVKVDGFVSLNGADVVYGSDSGYSTPPVTVTTDETTTPGRRTKPTPKPGKGQTILEVRHDVEQHDTK